MILDYDGDGNRVARLGADNKGTIFIGNYFEAVYPHNTIPDPPPPVTEGDGGENEPEASTAISQGDITYYYAGSQRIAMRDAWGVYFLFSDHLGSSSVVIDASGQIVEEGYYLPWGGERGNKEIELTDYCYTGQMKEGDVYYYNARWYDPELGRFMQADTIVPPTQGTQGFDRYAYVNNNPLRYIDPSGEWLCDSTEPGCWQTSAESFSYGLRFSKVFNEPLTYSIYGSYDFDVGSAPSIDRYQDDVISPTIISSHPLHTLIQGVDLAVRIMEEIQPRDSYQKTDDVFWSIRLEDSGDQITINQIFMDSSEDEVILRGISIHEPPTGRQIHRIIPQGINNLKFGFETGFVGTFDAGNPPNGLPFYSLEVRFAIRCYNCGGNSGLHLSGFDPYPRLPGSTIVFYNQ